MIIKIITLLKNDNLLTFWVKDGLYLQNGNVNLIFYIKITYNIIINTKKMIVKI